VGGKSRQGPPPVSSKAKKEGSNLCAKCKPKEKNTEKLTRVKSERKNIRGASPNKEAKKPPGELKFTLNLVHSGKGRQAQNADKWLAWVWTHFEFLESNSKRVLWPGGQIGKATDIRHRLLSTSPNDLGGGGGGGDWASLKSSRLGGESGERKGRPPKVTGEAPGGGGRHSG